jgi:hypothetical protein
VVLVIYLRRLALLIRVLERHLHEPTTTSYARELRNLHATYLRIIWRTVGWRRW